MNLKQVAPDKLHHHEIPLPVPGAASVQSGSHRIFFHPARHDSSLSRFGYAQYLGGWFVVDRLKRCDPTQAESARMLGD